MKATKNTKTIPGKAIMFWLNEKWNAGYFKFFGAAGVVIESWDGKLLTVPSFNVRFPAEVN